MYEHLVPHHTGTVSRNLFCKWGRRGAGAGQVLVAVPRASDASVNNLSFSKRPVLVLTHIRYCGDISVVFKYSDPLSSARHHAGAFLRDVLDGANGDISIRLRGTRGVLSPLNDSARHVERCDYG
jgi:hypothetical protein